MNQIVVKITQNAKICYSSCCNWIGPSFKSGRNRCFVDSSTQLTTVQFSSQILLYRPPVAIPVKIIRGLLRKVKQDMTGLLEDLMSVNAECGGALFIKFWIVLWDCISQLKTMNSTETSILSVLSCYRFKVLEWGRHGWVCQVEIAKEVQRIDGFWRFAWLKFQDSPDQKS